jgi:hypothetical protein
MLVRGVHRPPVPGRASRAARSHAAGPPRTRSTRGSRRPARRAPSARRRADRLCPRPRRATVPAWRAVRIWPGTSASTRATSGFFSSSSASRPRTCPTSSRRSCGSCSTRTGNAPPPPACTGREPTTSSGARTGSAGRIQRPERKGRGSTSVAHGSDAGDQMGTTGRTRGELVPRRVVFRTIAERT